MTTNALTSSVLGGKPVHRVGFGAMQLAGPNSFGPPADPQAAIAVLRHAVAHGVDHIDTAQFYGPDVVNDLIRAALHPYPENLRLATKVGAVRDEHGAWLPSGDPAALKRQVEQNLRTLRVERMDLVNLRRFERDIPDGTEAPLDDQLDALTELRDEGKIDMIGISSAHADTVEAAIKAAGVVAVQNAYSILNRTDDAVLQLCREHAIAFVPYFPLGSAFGSGGPAHLAADPHVSTVAAKYAITPAQVALAWLLARYERLLLIPGTRSIAHLEENLAVATMTLDAEDLARLDAVEPVPLGA